MTSPLLLGVSSLGKMAPLQPANIQNIQRQACLDRQGLLGGRVLGLLDPRRDRVPPLGSPSSLNPQMVRGYLGLSVLSVVPEMTRTQVLLLLSPSSPSAGPLTPSLDHVFNTRPQGRCCCGPSSEETRHREGKGFPKVAQLGSREAGAVRAPPWMSV